MRTITVFSLLLLLAACASTTPQRDRVIGGWQVMVTHPGKSEMLCYAGASPLKSAGALTRRIGKPYLMATRRPSGKIELSASAGYPFMPGSKVELVVDGKPYSLFYRQDVAWLRGDAQDKAAIDSLKAAQTIELHGLAKGGLTSVDTYSPHGFAAAIARIRELCP